MTQDITSLIEKLEGAEVGSRELDREIALRLESKLWLVSSGRHKVERNGRAVNMPAYSTSLDAALALAERALDQRGPININICLAGSAQVVIDSVGACDPVMAQVVARTPALALCAAILRAQSEAR